MKNQMTKWLPTDNILDIMFVEELHDDYEGFRILLQGEEKSSKILKLTFDDKLCYRNIDEGYSFNSRSISNNQDLGKTFYIIKNSSYIEYFHEITCNIYSDWDIVHYAIYTESDCIDILSCFEPKVEWLQPIM